MVFLDGQQFILNQELRVLPVHDRTCNGINQLNPDYLTSMFELLSESLPVSFKELQLTFRFMPKWLGHQVTFVSFFFFFCRQCQSVVIVNQNNFNMYTIQCCSQIARLFSVLLILFIWKWLIVNLRRLMFSAPKTCFHSHDPLVCS